MHFGVRMGITPHINAICKKSKSIFSQLARITKARWGLNTSIMETMYKCVFLPVVAYAAAGWVDKINAYHRKQLTQAQRYLLLRVTKAYRTVSSDALCVIAGAKPIELILEERKSFYILRKGKTFNLLGKQYILNQGITNRGIDQIKSSIYQYTRNA